MFDIVAFDPTQSRRKHELSVAKVKAHAARISHQRRRERTFREYEPDVEEAEPRPAQHEAHKVVIFASPVLLEGCSDPFTGINFKITPRINQILTFARDVCVPASFFSSMFVRLSEGTKFAHQQNSILGDSFFISRCAARREWQALVDSLHSELTALSCLLGYLSLMAIVTPGIGWIKVLSVQLRLRATQLLREKTPAYEKDPEALVLQVYRFFRAACIEGDIAAVDAHGRMLRSLLESGTGFTYQILIQALLSDGDFATKHARRCIFDVSQGSWCLNTLQKLWIMTDQFYPVYTAKDWNIHENVLSEESREMFAHARNMLHMSNFKQFPAVKWTERSAGDMAFAGLTSRSLYAHAQMNEHYLDLIENRVLSWTTEGVRWSQAAIVVALHYLKRRTCGEAVINGVNVRDASPALFGQLQIALNKAFEFCMADELETYADAHIWVLYIGAMEELRYSNKPNWQFGPLCRLLAAKIRHTRYKDWESMRSMAGQFLFADFVHPEGKLWWKDLLIWDDRESQLGTTWISLGSISTYNE